MASRLNLRNRPQPRGLRHRDTSVGELDIELDIEVVTAAAADPDINGITLSPQAVYITRMELDDELGATELGFDLRLSPIPIKQPLS